MRFWLGISFFKSRKQAFLIVMLLGSLFAFFDSVPVSLGQASTKGATGLESVHNQPIASQAIATVAFAQNVSDLRIAPSSAVSFQLNLTNGPPIVGVRTFFMYDRTVLQGTALDYSNSIFGSSLSVFNDCIDGTSVSNPLSGQCDPRDTFGSVDVFIIATPAIQLITPPPSGPLFTVSFNVLGVGLAPLHFISVELFNGTIRSPPAVQSFDGYFSNKQCGTVNSAPFVCQPAVADFTMSPTVPIQNTLTHFNASTSRSPNPAATIVQYSWNWGGGQLGITTTSNPLIDQSFSLAGPRFITLTVTDSFGVSGSKTLLVQVVIPPPLPSFIISAFPNDFDFIAGNNASASIELLSMNGFTGIVHLDSKVASLVFLGTSGITASLSVNALFLSPSGTNSTTLRISTLRTAPPGPYVVAVTGTSGALSSSATIGVHILLPSFLLGCIPPIGECGAIVITPGSSSTFPLLIRSLNGFSGTVTLTPQVPVTLPIAVPATGLTVSVSPAVQTVSANNTVFSVVTVSVASQTATGSYLGEIDGKSGTLFDDAPFGIRVVSSLPPDFAVQAASSVKVVAGLNTTWQVTVTSLHGFSGTLILFPEYAGFPVPTGLTVSSASSRISLSPGQSIVTNMTISTTESTPPGNYTVTAVGATFSTVHVAAASLVILPLPKPPVLVQLNWKHRLSLVKDSNTQTWKFGIANMDNSTTVFARLRIVAVDGSGLSGFTETSGVIQLMALQTSTNNLLTHTFMTEDIGKTFTFSVLIQWGFTTSTTNKTSIPLETDVPISGSFSIFT